jgi:hypothetical protein
MQDNSLSGPYNEGRVFIHGKEVVMLPKGEDFTTPILYKRNSPCYQWGLVKKEEKTVYFISFINNINFYVV